MTSRPSGTSRVDDTSRNGIFRPDSGSTFAPLFWCGGWRARRRVNCFSTKAWIRRKVLSCFSIYSRRWRFSQPPLAGA